MSDGLKVVGLDKFDQSVKRWLGAVEKQAADAAVGLAKQVFSNILLNSPQYSSDFVSGWKVDVDSIVPRFESEAVPGAAKWGVGGDVEPFGRGDQPGMDYAWSHAQFTPIRLGQTIFIHNSAKHDEPYAWLIEEGHITFRTPNMGADHVASNAISRVSRRFGALTKTQLDALRGAGV